MNELELMRQIGENIKSLLDEYGITQFELSQKTGISKTTISRYVHGEQMPSTKNLINIAYILECDISELIDADKFII